MFEFIILGLELEQKIFNLPLLIGTTVSFWFNISTKSNNQITEDVVNTDTRV